MSYDNYGDFHSLRNEEIDIIIFQNTLIRNIVCDIIYTIAILCQFKEGNIKHRDLSRWLLQRSVYLTQTQTFDSEN